MTGTGNRLPRKANVTGKPGNRVESETQLRMRTQAATAALQVETASQAKATNDGFAARDATLADYGQRLDNLENPAP